MNYCTREDLWNDGTILIRNLSGEEVGVYDPKRQFGQIPFPVGRLFHNAGRAAEFVFENVSPKGDISESRAYVYLKLLETAGANLNEQEKVWMDIYERHVPRGLLSGEEDTEQDGALIRDILKS